jgi:acyl-CoA reductase-like NAD-dependent aldehyde dehydrogenase
MPWNFPCWKVIRFAAPALMAGNTTILKHASNMPQCALALAVVFEGSGFPQGLFQTLLLQGAAVNGLIEDHRRIAAVTLTGSDALGSQVVATAGRAIKKTVIELGGSDAVIVLEDADLDAAVATGVLARYQNAGQSCIAAKRFIVAEKVFQAFQAQFIAPVRSLRLGDPRERSMQIGPLARSDLQDTLEQQVQRFVAQGARLLVAGERRQGRGYFFEPTVFTDVTPDMSASREEVFGPVAALLKVRDAEEAIELANASP